MIETLRLICVSFFIMTSFLIGFNCGSRKNSDKTITSTINPIKIVKEKKQTKKEQEEREREAEIDRIILANIDAYDGTSLGQQEIPRR